MAGQGGIVVPDENIALCVPEITLSLVHLCALLLLLFDSRETFPLLVSHAGRFCALATDKQCPASDQANELKLFHIDRSMDKWTL
jgi:hypothetical protein